MSDSSKSSTKNRKYCKLCTKNYAYSSGLTRHMMTVHVHENMIPDPPLLTTFFKCTKCSKIFGRKFNRDRHEIACSNTTCGVSTFKQREEAEMMSRGGGSGGGFNVQFGGGGLRSSTKIKWTVKKVRQCLNIAVTYRATPNIEITTIGGVHHAMQSFKTVIIDRFKMFHGVKIHFNVEGTCLYMG